MRSLHVTDGVMSWDGYDLPVAALSIKFCMLDIERYTRIGCPILTCSGMMGHRSLCRLRPRTQRQFSDTSYQIILHDQHRLAIPIKLARHAYLHPST